MNFLRWYLWIGPDILVGVCLAGLLLRRRQRQLPVFVTYLSFEIAAFLSSLTANELVTRKLLSIDRYRWVMTAGSALCLLVELCVLYELASELMVSRSSSARVLRGVLRWTAGILLLVAATVSASFSEPGLQGVVKVFQSLDFSSNLIIIGLLLSLMIFSRMLRVSWQSLPAGIALGFGVSASAEIASTSLLSLLGRPGYVAVDVVRGAAFHMCVLVWLFYIFRPPRASIMRGRGLGKLELESWDQQLGRMVR